MSKQPEALRLADSLEHDLLERNGSRLSIYMQEIADSSADELRRLHALNGELLKTLIYIKGAPTDFPFERQLIRNAVIAAIAKAEVA